MYHVGKQLTITDGLFSTSNGDENIQIIKSSEVLNAATCYISGGTFETSGEVNITAKGDPAIEITGGRFNKQVPAEFIKVGYKQTLESGYYTISKEE